MAGGTKPTVQVQVWEESEEQQVKITVSYFITSRGAGGWRGAPGRGGATMTRLRIPASSDASGALGCCCFGSPFAPAALPLSPEGEHGEVTASILPLNPRLFLTCPHEWSVAPDGEGSGGSGGDVEWWWGCNSKRRFILMVIWVIGKVPGFGGTVTSPWAGGRGEHLRIPRGTELCKELGGAQMVWEGARQGTRAGGDPAPRNPQSHPGQHPALPGGISGCSHPAPASAPPSARKRGRMKDELLAQLPPGHGTLPPHPPCLCSRIFQLR